MPLVVDCCGLVHAKAMSHLPHSPLDLLSGLAVAGARFLCTKPVLGELGESSLRGILGLWATAGWLTVEAPTLKERKQVLNRLRKGDARPGNNDLGLVVVARRLCAPMLTHDEAASQAARRCGVAVVELVDIAAWAARIGVAAVAEISEAWGGLRGLPWPGSDDPWHGSVADTVVARPAIEQVVDRLVVSAS